MGDDINQRLKPILKKTLKTGARVVSHRFLMGKDWEPDRSETIKATKGEYPGYENQIHLWTMARQFVLKLLLPQDDAVVKVDGTEVAGHTEIRTIKFRPAKDSDHIHLTAFWEPNNYTKITRPRKVTYQDGEIVVDFRTPSATEKDDIVVRFVPTPQEFVDAMCKLAKVTKNDVVYDLGCGDGRMVITAVKKFGAKRGVGVDIDPELVEKCKEAAKAAGVADRVEFRVGDVLKVEDLSDANVVLLYMGDDINARLKPILQKTLKPGSRVVSHRFLMGEDWPPEKSETIKATQGEYPGYENQIHLWTIGKKK
jgi:SAM-dependent methyltransferase